MSSSSVQRRREEGASAVEFALIAPLLLFLLFAIIGYGYMLSFRQALSQAAAEGARAAAVTPAGAATSGGLAALNVERRTRALEAVNQGLGSYGVACTSAGTVTRGGVAAAGSMCAISDATACSGSTTGATCVKVTIKYNYRDNSLLPSFPGLGVVLPDQLSYSTEAEVS